MRKLFFVVFVSLLGVVSLYAQDNSPVPAASPRPVAPTITVAEAKKAPSAPAKRGPIFRPTKDQIRQVQTLLKEKALYKGEATGTYNDDTRAAIRTYQKDNGLRSTGGLNRATLEKMNITLTDSQKAIPVSESSFASDENSKPAESKPERSASAEPKTKRSIFRATKEQVEQAQKLLKDASFYTGEQSGKLDDATRNGLKKYQEANGLKVTGALNRVTLEKMGIALTDAQKAM